MLQKHGVIKHIPWVARLHVYAVLIGLPVWEGLAVIATGFHYSVDVFVAWMFTLMMWTNPYVDAAALHWVKSSNRVGRKTKTKAPAKKVEVGTQVS